MKSTNLSNLEKIHGLRQDNIQDGSENTPGWGAKGTGAPPLISTSLDTRRALRLPRAAAKAHLEFQTIKKII